MKISLKASDPLKLSVDTLTLFYSKDNLIEELNKLPHHLVKELKELIKRENFSGEKNESVTFSGGGAFAAYKINIRGIGSNKDLTISQLWDEIAKSVKEYKQNKSAIAAINLGEEILKKFNPAICAQIVAEAIELSAYNFKKYKSIDLKKQQRELEEVYIVVSAAHIKQAEIGLQLGKITAKATLYSRDLVNEPAQITTPSFLANEALKIAKSSGGLVKAEVMEKEMVQKLGMNAFLGVARGSDEPAKFIILKYKAERSNKKIVIIGKGITFDTGGLSLKPPVHMETMKLDMAGAATVLGVFSALSDIKPNAEVIGLIAACENMPSGKALKPGDILRAYNGKTIEVLNTDAEGRLTLADVLSYAVSKFKPDSIIDFATLTGACMVALGQDYAGIFSNNDKLFKDLEKAAIETNEKIWRLPLVEEYNELNESKIADVKNIGSTRYAGAITAALFLQVFVGDTSWSHLDIAGPAFMEKDTPLAPYGGSGFGVRMTLQYLKNF